VHEHCANESQHLCRSIISLRGSWFRSWWPCCRYPTSLRSGARGKGSGEDRRAERKERIREGEDMIKRRRMRGRRREKGKEERRQKRIREEREEDKRGERRG
jgi:hypothetical protein